MPLENFLDTINKLKAFDFGQEMEQVVEDHKEVLVDLQREQMMAGKDVHGQLIRPFYSENPYFKTPESAARYAKWKQRITPHPERPEDVPNLFINGTFHNSIFPDIQKGTFEMKTDASFGDSVFAVHKDAQGLNEDSRLQFAETYTLPAIKESLLTKTGLKIS